MQFRSEAEIDAFEKECFQPVARRRDWQQKKVYKAEDALIVAGNHGPVLDDHDAIWAFALEVIRSDWWSRAGYPVIDHLFLRGCAFGFDHKVGVAGAIRLLHRPEGRARKEIGFLIFPLAGDWRSSKLVVLHEIAHLAQPFGEASHGKYWAGAYLVLVKQFLPELYEPLLAQFKIRGVRWDIEVRWTL